MTSRDQRISLDEYLGSLSSDVVFSLVPEGGTRRILSAAFIRELAASLRTPSAVAIRLSGLSDEAARLVCTTWLSGRAGLPADGLDPDLRGELLRSFLACLATTPEGRPVLLSFPDVVESAASTLAAWYKGRFAAPPPAPGTRLFAAPAADLAVLLCTVLAAPLPVNRDGDPAKPTVNALRRILHVRHCGPFAGDYRDAKAVIDFMLDFARSEGLVFPVGNTVHTTREIVEDWLTRNPQSVTEAMQVFARERDGAFDRTVFDALITAAGEGGLRLIDGTPRSREDLYGEQLTHYAWLGIIDAGMDSNRMVFAPPRTSFYAHADESSITILPDFSAIVPQESPLPLLALFHRCGTFTALDRIYKGAVTREAVTASICAGYTAEEIMATLDQFRAPPNVSLTVREWVREFSRVAVISAETVIAADERTAAQISGAPALQEVLEEVPCAKLFRVRAGQEGRAETLLAAMGFDPRFPGSSGSTPPAAVWPEESDDARLSVQTDVFSKVPSATIAVGSGKYSSELKALELADLLHVMDYAILMGNRLRLEVDAFPGTKAGEYAIDPVHLDKGAEGHIEGTPEGSKVDKKFPLKKILRIGVIYD